MADIDPERTCQLKLQALSLGICGMHDDWFYKAV